jgi:predicted RNA-binding protein associated with RNAse of E/G family
VGLDYLDNKLDLILYPDGSWKWKDEDELEESVARGLLRGGQARGIRKEGEEVLKRFRSGASPFGESWDKWTPDPQWQIPVLPAGWNL